jgi:hypothetical protein
MAYAPEMGNGLFGATGRRWSMVVKKYAGLGRVHQYRRRICVFDEKQVCV